MLSHGAVVAREYSLPCVVGITGACDLLATGMLVELDGDKGLVTILQGAGSTKAASMANKMTAVELKGTPVSSGATRGPCRVARTVEEAEQLREGEILITPQTDVGWTPFFSRAAGLVTEIGGRWRTCVALPPVMRALGTNSRACTGMLSHGAVVAREYSLPCVVGVTDACNVLQTGMMIELDGDSGSVCTLP